MATRADAGAKPRTDQIDVRERSRPEEPSKRWKAYLQDTGLMRSLAKDGLFTELVHKNAWSLTVTDVVTKNYEHRRIHRLRMAMPAAEELESFSCSSVGFTLGVPRKTGKLTVQMLERFEPGKPRRLTTTFQGDLNVLIPRTGLIPIGVLASSRPGLYPDVHARPLKLHPEFANLLKGRSEVEFKLGESVLVIDGWRNRFQVLPSVDLRGKVFRIEDTGVLVTFDALSVHCEDGTPNLRFRGGRFWKQGGAQ